MGSNTQMRLTVTFLSRVTTTDEFQLFFLTKFIFCGFAMKNFCTCENDSLKLVRYSNPRKLISFLIHQKVQVYEESND